VDDDNGMEKLTGARRHDITSAEERHPLCEQLHKRWLSIGRKMKVADKIDRAALLHERIVIDLHDAQRGAPFPETLAGQFSLLDEIVKRCNRMKRAALRNVGP
jgi:hypothetical protein